jgi:hypothetical protein
LLQSAVLNAILVALALLKPEQTFQSKKTQVVVDHVEPASNFSAIYRGLLRAVGQGWWMMLHRLQRAPAPSIPSPDYFPPSLRATLRSVIDDASLETRSKQPGHAFLKTGEGCCSR